MAAPTLATVHMSVGPRTLGSLSRRGHGRLRQLQSHFPEVSMCLDHVHNALLLTGPAHRVDDLRQQIAGLLGRAKKVPVALWAELMRTRKSNEGLIVQLQNFSGSRIHIDRDKYELCIYGSDGQNSVANRLLDQVAKECIRERLLLDTSQLGEQKLNNLHELAAASNIVIQVKEKEIVVLGIRDAVKQACEKGFLKRLCDNALLGDELLKLGTSMHNQQAAQEFSLSRQTTAGTAEFPEDQVSCQTSVSSADTLSDPKQRFYRRCLGPWIPMTVSSTAASAAGRTAPSVTPSSLRQGQLCPSCGLAVNKDANFCFACGQLVRATPSIEAAMEAASFAQSQPLMQATMLPVVISRESL